MHAWRAADDVMSRATHVSTATAETRQPSSFQLAHVSSSTLEANKALEILGYSPPAAAIFNLPDFPAAARLSPRYIQNKRTATNTVVHIRTMSASPAQNPNRPTTIRQPEPVQLHTLHTAQPPTSQPMSNDSFSKYLSLSPRMEINACKQRSRPPQAAPRERCRVSAARRAAQQSVPRPVLLLRAVSVAL